MWDLNVGGEWVFFEISVILSLADTVLVPGSYPKPMGQARPPPFPRSPALPALPSGRGHGPTPTWIPEICGKEGVLQTRFSPSRLPSSWGAQKVSGTNRANVFIFRRGDFLLPPSLCKNEQIFPSPRRSQEIPSSSLPVTLQSRLKLFFLSFGHLSVSHPRRLLGAGGRRRRMGRVPARSRSLAKGRIPLCTPLPP